MLTIIRFGDALGSSIGCGAPRTETARRRALRESRNRGHLGVTSGSVGGRYAFGIVVLDGYDTITVDGVAHPIPHNAFVRSYRSKPSRVLISGPAGERRVRLG
jgi:hypothetical protein